MLPMIFAVGRISIRCVAVISPLTLPAHDDRIGANLRHVTRPGGFGDFETEHQKLAMDPWRTPDKVVTGHPYDQMADFPGNPRTPAAPATPGSISQKR